MYKDGKKTKYNVDQAMPLPLNYTLFYVLKHALPDASSVLPLYHICYILYHRDKLYYREYKVEIGCIRYIIRWKYCKHGVYSGNSIAQLNNIFCLKPVPFVYTILS